jgi:hypothetical protein
MTHIIIGKINSMFRFTTNCEYLAIENALAPNDKSIVPVLTAPLIAIINPITTIIIEILRI